MAGTTFLECGGRRKKTETAETNEISKNVIREKEIYLEGVAEELLSSVERHVLERMRIDLDDAVVNGDASIPVNPAAGLDALHQ